MAFPAIFGLISSLKGQQQQDASAAQLHEKRLAPNAQANLDAMSRRQEAIGSNVQEVLAKAQAGVDQIQDQKEREAAAKALQQAQEAERQRLADEERKRQAQGGAGLGMRAE